MAKVKFNLDKMVTDAQERLSMYINQLVIKAQAETTADFVALKQKAQ